jgi:hypothetical protein
MLSFGQPGAWNRPETPVCANPEFWVYLILWYDVADENVSSEKIIMHRLSNDLCDRARSKFDEGIEF